jgi:DNA-binding MarR family transcriptional regulator
MQGAEAMKGRARMPKREMGLVRRTIRSRGDQTVKSPKYVSDLTTDERALMAILRAAEGFKRGQTEVCRAHGLSFPQYNVLRVLEASENGRNMVSGVSKIMLVPVANMTGLAKGLERDGFIRRSSDPDDERVTVLEITPKGRKSLEDIRAEKDAHLAATLAGFSADEKLDLLEKARRILRNGKAPRD